MRVDVVEFNSYILMFTVITYDGIYEICVVFVCMWFEVSRYVVVVLLQRLSRSIY